MMPATTVGAADPYLAQVTGLPCDPKAAFVLRHGRDGLELADTRPGAPGPLQIAFGEGTRGAAGLKLPLARAAGVRRGHTPTVLDATAGLGRDAYSLALLGCPVTAVERHPAIAALLRDALERAGGDPAASRITLVAADAIAYMATAPRAQVVLLDPMFPERGTAKARKEMQYFRELMPPDEDELTLLQAALRYATERVVLKRHAKAPPLLPGVNHSIPGKTVRFDVYLGLGG
jgi:16S rRNA (guanine1516-N2)-methyltransferase